MGDPFGNVSLLSLFTFCAIAITRHKHQNTLRSQT